MWTLALLGGLLLLNLALPVLNLFAGFPWATAIGEITAPGARDAIRTSLLSAAIATTIAALLGVPLAYVLARGRIRWRNLLIGIVFLPLVLPPIVAGVLLLLLYGPYGWVGAVLERFGIALTNNLTGIVLSQILVAGPFVVIASLAAFEAVDEKCEQAAATLGDSPIRVFWRIALPLALAGVLAGVMLAWVRSLGEFGATLVMAYNPHTLPIYLWVAFQTDGLKAALPLALVLLVLAGVGLGAAQALRRNERAAHAPVPVEFPNATAPEAKAAGSEIATQERMRAEPRGQSAPAGDGGAALAVSARKALRHRGHVTFTLDAELTVPPGITVLFGRSGAGKTTVLEFIAGLASPDEGTIVLGERPLFDSGRNVDLPPASRHTGFVFAGLALFPHLTAEQNIGYGLQQLPEAERRRRVDEILLSFRISHLRGRMPHQISSGESQRVALARTLVTEPRVLLLDEPLSSLDATTKGGIIDDLRAWNRERRIPVLLVTHDREEAIALGDSAVVMEHGRVIAEGPAVDVLEMPRHETVAQISGFENIFSAAVTALHEREGTMTCRIAGTELNLDVPIARTAAPQAIRIAVRGGDILLAASRPEGLSARNVFPGTVTGITRAGPRVVVRIDCGASFTVHVTPGAAESLQLARGRAVWLILKSYSCHILS
jgi:molybdenum ABC transporter ATP-binding protein